MEKTTNSLPKVLIVDDSRIVRVTLIKHLKGAYEIREEGDGEAGWQALMVDPDIQVVLSDLTMPKLDGYGLLERIRSSKLSRIHNVPVLLISGDEDESARARAKALGASDFIAKGIGSSELLTRLASLVKLAQTQNELDESRDGQVKDPQTGLYTLAYAEEQCDKMLAYASRYQVPSSVIVIAVDQAPMIRQKAGDAAAAQLMKAFAQLLLQKIRREDTLAMYGPNEMVVISPATPDGGAMIFAERIRETFEQANITFQGKRLKLTASVGFSATPPDATDNKATGLLKLAGERMESARKAGGNRIIGSEGHVAGAPGAPTLDTALMLARTGREAELVQHLPELTMRVMPLLEAANKELKLGLDMAGLMQKLRERAQK